MFVAHAALIVASAVAAAAGPEFEAVELTYLGGDKLLQYHPETADYSIHRAPQEIKPRPDPFCMPSAAPQR
jgi:hypothetical protein